MSDIKVGDFVIINGQDTIGEVLSIRGNALEVLVGLMKVNVKLAKVSLTAPPSKEDQYTVETEQNTSYSVDTKEKMLHFKFELDVRGKLKEDVLLEVSNWIDDAVLLGVEEAKIIHGRGSGVLKDTVRGLLRKYKEIEKFGDELRERGGDSVTVVKFAIR